MHLRTSIISLAVLGLLAAAAPSQTIQAPFSANYSYVDLGSVPGIPGPLGGITFKHDDPNVILLGGAANSSAGAIYAVPVTRNAAGQITGFGTPTLHATAPDIDGGLTYGPGNVLFATGYPNNTLMQFLPGSGSPDSTIDLNALGIASSVGTCQFVPTGYAAAGSFKILSWNASIWYDVTLVPNTAGLFDITNVAPGIAIFGGPEGVLYPPPGSPLLTDFGTVLVSEYSAGSIGVYDIDSNGDVLPATRRDFMTGLVGAEGAVVDPLSGDMLFSTFGGGDRVIAVRGFQVCGFFQNYGQGLAGGNGVPSLTGTGCPNPGAPLTIDIGNGPASAMGLLGFGPRQANIPILGGAILVDIDVALPVMLDAAGSFSLSLNVPNAAAWNSFDTYWQAGFPDNAAPFGATISRGLRVFIL